MRGRTVATLAVLAVLVSVLAVSVAAPAAGSAAQEGGQNATQADYSLGDLQQSGEIRDQRYPSLRVLSESQYLWAVTYKTGPLATYGSKQHREVLSPGDRIARNQFQFLASHPYDGESHNYTVRVVYWHPENKRSQTPNGTTTERVANITGMQDHTITFAEGPRRPANVSLIPHYDDPERVTVFLLDADGDIRERWGPYVHKSVQTSQALPFGNSWASFLPWLFTRFFLTIGGGGIAAIYFGLKTPKKAGEGPGKGLGWWVFVTAFVGGIVLFGWWAQIVALIVAAPFLLAIPAIAATYVVTAEWVQSSKRGLFEQLTTSQIQDPTGDHVPDIEGEHGDEVHVVEMDGKLGFIKSGSISSFLARYFAGPATVPLADIPKRYPYDGDSRIDEKFYVESVEFTPARWTFELPSLKRWVETDDGPQQEWNLKVLAYPVVTALVGALLFRSVWNAPYWGFTMGLLPVAGMGLHALSGEVAVEWSPGYASAAKAARVTEESELLKWETFTELSETMGKQNTEGYEEALDILDAFKKQVEERLEKVFNPNGHASGKASDTGDDTGEVSASGD